MDKPDDAALTEYYREAASWADDRASDRQSRLRLAWIVAGLAGGIAMLEAIALVVMMPLKRIEPIAVMVDRQTGFVQPLNLAKGQAIIPDEALIRAMLAQYVTAREGFNIAALKEDYRKVALWSTGDARSQYVAATQASNPSSQLANLPRNAVVSVEIRSISRLSADSYLVRFATMRSDPGSQPVLQGLWVSVVRYRFSSADMTAESRLVNPLGFQVLRYDRSAELDPTPQQPAAPAAPAGAVLAPAPMPGQMPSAAPAVSAGPKP